MADYAMCSWLQAFAPPPQLSYGEIMDRLFDLWCKTDDGRTFEEFIAASGSGSE